MLFAVATVAAVTPLIALVFDEGSTVVIGVMVLLGGSMFPFYSLTVAYSNDWLEAKEILGASATLVRVNGTGAVVGPLLAGSLMSAYGARLFFWSITGSLAWCRFLYSSNLVEGCTSSRAAAPVCPNSCSRFSDGRQPHPSTASRCRRRSNRQASQPVGRAAGGRVLGILARGRRALLGCRL